MDIQEKIRNEYSVALDYAKGEPRPPAPPVRPHVLSPEGDEPVAREVLHRPLKST